jgi:hypothetical protein
VCLSIVFFTMASPIAWIHHYGVLLPAYPVAARSVLHTRSAPWLRLALLCLSFVLTGMRWPAFGNTTGWWSLLEFPVFTGALLLGVVLIRQFLDEAAVAEDARALS